MRKRGWEIPEREATPEEVFLNRRRFIKAAGLASIAALAGCSGDEASRPLDGSPTGPTDGDGGDNGENGDNGGNGSGGNGSGDLYPATRNPGFAELDRPLTDETVAAQYNNFWEFTTGKDVWRNIGDFESRPWTLEVAGLVQNPRTYDIDNLIRALPLEERLYRHRCVEAWSMAIPWTGFPMKALLDVAQPLSSARFVTMTSFLRPEQAKGQWDRPDYPWAYTEGLTIAEAANELTMLATGVYGHELPDQHGAPIRLVVPWKYGFKGIKSIVRIEFTEQQPLTFWPELQSAEYGFYSIVNPEAPHRRWSQAQERFIQSSASSPAVRPTLLFNGYGEYVADLYTPGDLQTLA